MARTSQGWKQALAKGLNTHICESILIGEFSSHFRTSVFVLPFPYFVFCTSMFPLTLTIGLDQWTLLLD